MHPRTKRRIWIAVIVVLVLVGVRLTVFRPFDSAEWIGLGAEKQLHGPSARRWMYLDLKLRNSPVGMTREQVLELLGSPVKRKGGSEFEMLYPMGRAPMSLKTLYMGLEFQDGRVARVALEKSAS